MKPVPKIMGDGCYDPVGLWAFLKDTSRTPQEMASDLNVPAHRIIYALGSGREMFRHRAAVYRLARIGRQASS